MVVKEPVAPVVQLVTLKPSYVGTWVRISVQSQELGFSLTINIIDRLAIAIHSLKDRCVTIVSLTLVLA